jgi:hypothetical protein
MTDKINITVERGGEFHKFVFGDVSCKNCSLNPVSELYSDVCEICCLLCGHFEKVVV